MAAAVREVSDDTDEDEGAPGYRVRVRVIGLGLGCGQGLARRASGEDEGLDEGSEEGSQEGVASPLFAVSSVAAEAALSSSASNILMACASSCQRAV